MQSVFPVITTEKQKQFEATQPENSKELYIPCICGYLGRACRQMNKEEGANRAICDSCSLSNFCKEN